MVSHSWDLQPFVDWISTEYLPSAKSGPGPADYGLRPGQQNSGLYGTADAACVLYSIDQLDTGAGSSWLEALAAYQDPIAGFFVAETASLAKAHNTGFAIAAMNLFQPDLTNGVLPTYPLAFADLIADPTEATRYADSLDWRGSCYTSGERLVGLASSFFNVSEVVPAEWFDWLVDYIEQTKLDPMNGMVGVDKPPGGDLDQVGGTFHFDFFWASLGKDLPGHSAREWAVRLMQLPSGLWDPNNPWWLTFDAVYMLGRTIPLLKLDPEQQQAAKSAIELAVDALVTRATDPAQRASDFGDAWMGVHNLTGAISFFAYVQQILGPDAVKTDQPLRLVLDRRPYI